MSWKAVVAALDEGELLQSRVPLYQHPLAGRPIIWHVLRALAAASPAPSEIRVLHRATAPLNAGGEIPAVYVAVEAGGEARALRSAVTAPGMTVLADGASPLVTPETVARLLRAGENGVAALFGAQEHAPPAAIAGEGPALASGEDPRHPVGAARVAPTAADELLRVVDRHSLARAGVVARDRLVTQHEAAGVSFLLPETTWVEVDVEIGADTLIYPGVVLEGATRIGAECVIGPHSRLVEARIGRGVELLGWNYVTRTSIRNHVVLEAYERRGVD